MAWSLSDSAVWRMISQADSSGKAILLTLFALSILCVAVIGYKFWLFFTNQRALRTLAKSIRAVHTLPEALDLLKRATPCAGTQWTQQVLSHLRRTIESGKTQLTDRDLEQLELVAEQEEQATLSIFEEYLPVLSTSAAISPLIGLLGTVWGLIHAFVDIAQAKTADIATVAPGMAEALTTTLAGLLVAIPALAAFHYFSYQTHRIARLMEQITDKLMSLIIQQFGQ